MPIGLSSHLYFFRILTLVPGLVHSIFVIACGWGTFERHFFVASFSLDATCTSTLINRDGPLVYDEDTRMCTEQRFRINIIDTFGYSSLLSYPAIRGLSFGKERIDTINISDKRFYAYVQYF